MNEQDLNQQGLEDLVSQLDALASGLPDTQRLDPILAEDVEDLRQDREQRKLYAKWAYCLMVGQLIVLNALMGGVGVGCLEYDKYLFHAYVLATFGEIVGVVYLVAKYLFPARTN